MVVDGVIRVYGCVVWHVLDFGACIDRVQGC